MMVGKNIILAFASLAITSCSLIDDDLDDCGQDVTISYELKSSTDIREYINGELSAEAEKSIGDALYASIADIFRNYAYDIDLSFYTTDGERANHEVHQMNASKTTYTLFLQQDDYHHVAIANEAKEGAAGLFTGRKSIKVANGNTPSYYVPLYMADCAMALVVDLNGIEVSGLKMVGEGFADSFSANDSTYSFANSQEVSSVEIPLSISTHRCFYTINYPSPNTASGNNGLWRAKLYVTMPDGKVTENIISVNEPLKAGYLKILKVKLKEEGKAEAVTLNVGVSVTLDWKEGGTYEPTL